MSSSAQAQLTPLPLGTAVTPGTLRAEIETRRASRQRFDFRQAIGVVVPLCTQLAELHAQGRTLFVHPSSLGFQEGVGVTVLEHLAHTPPSLPRDRSCLAPEERKGMEGDARASVFTIGAILYELLTGQSVGPGMRRPAEVVPDLPPALEVLLGKALVADPRHRPADLNALAQALHHIAPSSSIAPPAADESHLDHDEGFDVDVSLSMIPPAPKAPSGVGAAAPVSAPTNSQPRLHLQAADGPFNVAVAEPAPSSRRADDPTRRLADMKAALESDPRPRYVVIKDGMDHGPFSAVELLQQLASGAFNGDMALRDAFSEEERFIKDWEEFAPFAEQAKLNREIKQEKRALEAVVTAEKKGTQYKALIGGSIIAIAAAAALGLWMRDKKNRERELAVQSDGAMSIDVDGGLAAGKRPGGGGGVGVPGGAVGGGNHPVLAGGMSCEGAQARYVEDYSKMGEGVPPDLSAGAYGAVLNRGGYLNSCGVPSNMEVNICAAVQNGRAVGVTVTTRPSNPGVASCVAGAVRGLGFPAHPRLDVTRTTFAAN